MSVKDEVLNFVQMNGPVHTTQISQNFKLNSTFAGAYLSELVAGKKIKVSHIKIGTSPLYFIQGQEARLLNYLKHLDEKEQVAVQELNENKVLQDTKLEPITRVALRNSKDFAVPLRVNLKTGPELFWKWHLTNKEEAEKLIRKSLNILTEEEEALVKQQEEEKKKFEEDLRKLQEERLKQLQEEEKKRLEEELEKQSELHKKNIEKELKKDSKEFEALKKKHQELQKQFELKERELRLLQEQPPLQEQQLKITSNHKKMKSEKDEFTLLLANYLEQKNIQVMDYRIIKPESEIDATVQLPTVLGHTTYFCKAKNRKRINEGDLSSALLQSQMNNLPAIFLSPGTLTKNTQDLLPEKFKAMIVKKL